ncbi:MAG: alpha/beta hydrolase [Betaproteobacteria bacterium]|nr:MAG: alpha/beta hydrolase [Betaproteobacteria bacterium]
MTRKQIRRTILISALALLLVAGLWLYFTVYRSTASILYRAENFLFTRMTVNQLGDHGSTRYFFVTNRQKTEEAEILENRFGNVRGPKLSFGFFDTTIEPTVGFGMFVNPSEWFQSEEIRVNGMDALEQEAFVERLAKLVNASPQRSLLIIIHGFRERFPSALRKTAFVGTMLDINSPVMLFDWPGDQGSTLRGYRRARAVASESGAELAVTLELIISDIGAEKVWLIANSMGAQVVVDAFSRLYQKPEFADAQIEIEDVVLTAPDASREGFDQQFKRELSVLTRNLTVYVSSNDRALVMSRIVNRDARLGESTLGPAMRNEAARFSEVMSPGEDVVTLVDVTPVNRTRNFHNFSLETPEFFDDLFIRLTNEQTPNTRTLYRLETEDGANYWVLTPGR